MNITKVAPRSPPAIFGLDALPPSQTRLRFEAAWRAVVADHRLTRARESLSADELSRIISHAFDASR